MFALGQLKTQCTELNSGSNVGLHSIWTFDKNEEVAIGQSRISGGDTFEEDKISSESDLYNAFFTDEETQLSEK